MSVKFINAILVISLLSGCSSTREITKMDDYLTKEELLNPNHRTIDRIKKHYFTSKAYEAIKNIPAIDGPAISGYSAGVNFWSNVASFVTCNGIGRKIIVPRDSIETWGIAILIHEYTHHLDDMTRDGEENFINYDDFKTAYKLLSQDMHWAGLYIWAERQNDMLTSQFFGVGDMSEQIAYIAQYLALKGGPDYMKYVFRRILKMKYENEVGYTSIHGERRLLILNELYQD